MKIYTLIEYNKYGNYIRSFKTKAKRNKVYKELLKNYSTEYNKTISNKDQLSSITFGEVHIDLLDSILEV